MSKEKISSGDKDFDSAIMKFFPAKRKKFAPANNITVIPLSQDPTHINHLLQQIQEAAEKSR